MNRESTLSSVGIDVGTTTTQLIISKLTLTNVMPGSQVPKIEVSHKSIAYVGRVHFTPFIDRDHVDGAALKEIIAREYQRAGVDPACIDTGAIIITGQSARKKNAAEIVHSLAEFAGDFVVATAGPDLESIIAGKGSGAEQFSREQQSRVANVDIGGGTTNIAFFDSGHCIGTACIHTGGRLFEVDPLSGRLQYTAPPAERVVDYLCSLGLITPEDSDLERIIKTFAIMVNCTDRVMLNESSRKIDQDLVITNSLPPVSLDAVVYSGGVARYIYQPGHKNWWIHGDAGPILAKVFCRSRIYSGVKILQGNETIHATVVGAGAHTLNVSGSTIHISVDKLPLRNVPAVYPETMGNKEHQYFSWKNPAAALGNSIYRTVALVIPALPDTRFNTITRIAENLCSEIPDIPGTPVVIVAEQDIAKVLGQMIQSILEDLPLICLDGIQLHTGDYLDIARPLPHQDAVPVIVKTLVFAQ